MNPEELIGDRFSVLFIAFLVLVTSMQTDLGIGKVSTMLWVDLCIDTCSDRTPDSRAMLSYHSCDRAIALAVNLVQLTMVLLAVAESLCVHYLLKTNRPAVAINFDQVMRKAILLGMYPVTTVAVFLWGLEQSHTCPHTNLCGVVPSSSEFENRPDELRVTAIVLCTLGNSAVFFLSLWKVLVRMQRLDMHRRLSAARVILSLASDGTPPREGADIEEASVAKNRKTKKTTSVSTFNVFREPSVVNNSRMNNSVST
jgi:hypothetical protein